MMTSVQVVETSVNVCQNCQSNCPSQDYTHPDDHTSPTYDMTPEFKPFTACKICKKGSLATYDEMLHVHERKSWDGFAQRLLICLPEHRATKKPLLAGYVSIPAQKQKNACSQVKPVSTRDTPHPQQRACALLLHSPHEGIVLVI